MTLRPELHFVPEEGILQAPAGALLEGDNWHVFYQYRPGASQPPRWGHTYSVGDPYYWLECDDVLAPAGGEVELRAGAVATVDKGTNIYFTSVTNSDTSISLAKLEGIGEEPAVSDDPTSVNPNVFRMDRVIVDGEGHRRFRTPCVVPDWADADREEAHDGWLMIALTGSHDEPVPVILRSPDGDSWQVCGPLTFVGDTGLEDPTHGIVSPRLFRLYDDVKEDIFDILCVTLTTGGKEVAGYLVGKLAGTEFKVTEPFHRLDFGHDFTLPRVTHISDPKPDRRYPYDKAFIFGLLNGRGRNDNPAKHISWKEEGWANALSLPRKLTLQDGRLFQTPPKNLPRAVEDSHAARLWTGLISTPKGSELVITLLDGNGQPAATVTHTHAEVSFDRSLTRAFGQIYSGDAPATAPLFDTEDSSLTVVVDGATVEIFADSGLVAMASRIYFDGGCSGFKVDTTGAAKVLRCFEVTGS